MFQIRPLSMVFILLVVVVSLSYPASRTSASPEVAREGKAWQHMAFSVDGEKLSNPDVSRKINKIGEDGWELVDVETMVKGGTTTRTVYFFKRPKR